MATLFEKIPCEPKADDHLSGRGDRSSWAE